MKLFLGSSTINIVMEQLMIRNGNARNVREMKLEMENFVKLIVTVGLEGSTGAIVKEQERSRLDILYVINIYNSYKNTCILLFR